MYNIVWIITHSCCPYYRNGVTFTDAGLLIGKQILIMFIILFIGLFCSLKGMITKEGTKQLSTIELHIVNPLLIIMSFQIKPDKALVGGLLWSFGLSAVSFTAAILLTTLTISKKREDFDIERFSSVYSNCGFMGIPLISSIYGQEGVLYLTGYITLFNLLVWTHGFMEMKGERDFSSLMKAFLNPSVIAVFIGLIFFVTGIKIPSIPAASFDYISAMNSPLGMIIAGAAASQTNFLKALKNKGLYLVIAMKLLIVPAVCFAAMRFLGAPDMVLIVVTIAAACPAATTGTMFAVLFDKKPERCSEYFAVTTLLSGLSLPLITMLATRLC